MLIQYWRSLEAYFVFIAIIMGNCLPFKRRTGEADNTVDKYHEFHNELLKEKLVTKDIQGDIDQFNDKIGALETKVEMSRYEVDMALQYLGQTVDKLKKKMGVTDEELENI